MLAGATLVTLTASRNAAGQAAQHPDLSGRWTYNALLVYSDGRKLKQQVEGGGDVEIKGRWQGYDFVLERKVSGGGKVTEDYLKSQDGKQLYVIVSVDGLRRQLEFRRVYDAT